MNEVLIDCERTKHPHSGLYHFCRSLGLELVKQADAARDSLNFYVPRTQIGFLGDRPHYAIQRDWHRLYQPSTGRYDVWHCTSQTSRYYPRNRRTRMLLTIHDLNFLVERDEQPRKIEKYLRRVQAHVDRAQHIVCVSEFTRRTVAAHVDTGSTPVDVVYNGCNVNEFPDFDSPIHRPSRPFLFAIGTVYPKKNFHTLPPLLVGNDYELVIAGVIDPGYGARIEAAARAHGVTERVKLIGPVREVDKHWYYRNCRAFVFPSIAEGFGLPAIEAMYYGKPAFLARRTSLPEIGGDQAYYFDDFEPRAMRAVLEQSLSAYDRTQPGDRIRQRALRFSWPEAAAAYLRIYRSLYSR